MSDKRYVTLDGNEAAAYVAHMTNEVIAIYPITPSSPMGELSDAWSAEQRTNLWGTVPEVIELQSEGGAAGAVHGALQTGALATTFTASQGLLLKIPNMYKIAGELTPTVFHVAARTLATHALSIFGDHSDVMAARATGFAFLASNSVQEVMDSALIAQAATLEGRVPVLHFFDGFRTSHEVAKVEMFGRDIARAMIDDGHVIAHRQRALSPDRPVVRGTAQNPDVFFQAREACNPYYEQMPSIVQAAMDRFAALTGRQYRLFDYVGAPDAERVIVIMGSGAETVEETVSHLVARGEKVGAIKVRLYRPFSADALLHALPTTVTRIAVLDRTKEPGADGEPLYKDVLTAIADAFSAGKAPFANMPRVVGGRYGLSSKEFTPAMVQGVYNELTKIAPRNHFTVGIVDDVSHSSLIWDESFRSDASKGHTRAVFYGLGSDGTVSANKNTIKILGEDTDFDVQGYFEYDSKKAGAMTVSHLRFARSPIRSPYLIGAGEAEFVACHQPVFVETNDVLEKAAPGATFLLNTPTPPDQLWDSLPLSVQEQVIEKKLDFWCIDAYAVARNAGMGSFINTVMQTCFFAISKILPRDEAIAAIKREVEKTYGKKGADMLARNFRAIDEAVAGLHQIKVPGNVTTTRRRRDPLRPGGSEFVRQVAAPIVAGRGNQLPVSLMPHDGTFPVGTTALEKRGLAHEIPEWVEDLCIACGKCPFVCPHAAIRSKVFPESAVAGKPEGFKHIAVKGKDFEPGSHISYQVAPEDCTGCGLCVEICPAVSKKDPTQKALKMVPLAPVLDAERRNWDYFLTLPEYDRSKVSPSVMKSAMVMQPLFEFSSACVGCGETPYIRLATQLFGDRMLIANATGCSSIFGGNLPTHPWTTDACGRGPTWANSLFEDNAEFALGFRVTVDKQRVLAEELVRKLSGRLGDTLVEGLLKADQSTEAGIYQQRQRVEQMRKLLAGMKDADARNLESVADQLVKKSVWAVGGDGWAYDIGFGGLDHVFASGRDVNILVLDTEVYSNTGGQASKATPTGAAAKFAASGKSLMKKDLAQIAMSYRDVYVAQVAFGAKDVHTLRAFLEAESYPGVSVIIAYSPCREHGIRMEDNLLHQELAVNSGHWPLFRYDPRRLQEGKNPLQLDSKRPTMRFDEFASKERRFAKLFQENRTALERAQRNVDARFQYYEMLAGLYADGEVKDGAEKPKKATA